MRIVCFVIPSQRDHIYSTFDECSGDMEPTTHRKMFLAAIGRKYQLVKGWGWCHLQWKKCTCLHLIDEIAYRMTVRQLKKDDTVWKGVISIVHKKFSLNQSNLQGLTTTADFADSLLQFFCFLIDSNSLDVCWFHHIHANTISIKCRLFPQT